MRNKTIGLWLFVVSMMLFAGTISAQDEVCPDVAINAMNRVSEVCGSTGRNQVCYGNFRIDAHLLDESAVFANPADIVPVEIVEELHTYGLDVEDDSWGLALLRIQADLPDTIPGQNVTFLLYGDVTLSNAGSAAQPEVVAPCQVRSTGVSNTRSGPGTNHNVTGATAIGQELTVDGQNQAGDWLHLQDGAWLYASLTENISCDFAVVPVLEADTGKQYGPMQAFYFRTGLGQSDCAEVPPDSLVIRSPGGIRVALNVNGVEITVGSTIALTAQPDADMVISVLDGVVTATAEDVTVSAAAGNAIAVPMDDHLEPAAPPQMVFAPIETMAPITNTPAEVFEDNRPVALPDGLDTLLASGALDTTWTGVRSIITTEGECADVGELGNEQTLTSAFSYDSTLSELSWAYTFEDGRAYQQQLAYVGGQTFSSAGTTMTFTSPTSFSVLWTVAGPTSSAACEGSFTNVMTATAN